MFLAKINKKKLFESIYKRQFNYLEWYLAKFLNDALKIRKSTLDSNLIAVAKFLFFDINQSYFNWVYKNFGQHKLEFELNYFADRDKQHNVLIAVVSNPELLTDILFKLVNLKMTDLDSNFNLSEIKKMVRIFYLENKKKIGSFTKSKNFVLSDFQISYDTYLSKLQQI
ncbi:MAG: hypothetical protein KatS3mg090_0333 [Patescibacteria group bacterium]|nr:MAG: hypothetical protein KatS3mg090_0333 [Patescibacteria group bacterium]